MAPRNPTDVPDEQDSVHVRAYPDKAAVVKHKGKVGNKNDTAVYPVTGNAAAFDLRNGKIAFSINDKQTNLKRGPLVLTSLEGITLKNDAKITKARFGQAGLLYLANQITPVGVCCENRSVDNANKPVDIAKKGVFNCQFEEDTSAPSGTRIAFVPPTIQQVNRKRKHGDIQPSLVPMAVDPKTFSTLGIAVLKEFVTNPENLLNKDDYASPAQLQQYLFAEAVATFALKATTLNIIDGNQSVDDRKKFTDLLTSDEASDMLTQMYGLFLKNQECVTATLLVNNGRGNTTAYHNYL